MKNRKWAKKKQNKAKKKKRQKQNKKENKEQNGKKQKPIPCSWSDCPFLLSSPSRFR